MFRSARPTARCTLLALVLPLLAAVTLAAATAPTHAAPAGFAIENLPFTGLDQPTNVEFAATGQVFVAERRGVIKVYDNLDDASSRQTADLRLRVYNNGDRGLLGMVLDPDYPARPYLWALYTKDAEPGGTVPKYGSATSDTDPCPVDGGANDCRVSAELSRLTLDPATGTWTGQEAVLLGGGWCQQYGSHTIGTVEFGTDGYLYVGSGDAASYNQVDTGNLGSQRCADVSGWGGALRSQSARQPAGTAVVPHGAILRIDPDTGARRHRATPSSPTPTPCASGSSPTACATRSASPPDRARTEVWVGDVGWTRFEELEQGGGRRHGGELRLALLRGHRSPARLRRGGRGRVRDALCPGGRGRDASGARLRPRHPARLRLLPAGARRSPASRSAVESMAYPASYRSGVFFADYSRRCVWFAQLNGGEVVAGSTTVFDSTMYAAELETGPGGDLYAVDIATGEIKRIRYNAGGNTPPIASPGPTRPVGQTPLTVQFDGSGSADPDAGSSISYAWDLDGDGAFDDSTAVSPSWTYTIGGTVTARLRVTDNLGATDVDTVTVTAGSDAPTVVSLNSAASTTPWRVGDTRHVHGRGHRPGGRRPACGCADDPAGRQALPQRQRVPRAHPGDASTGSASGSFVGPGPRVPRLAGAAGDCHRLRRAGRHCDAATRPGRGQPDRPDRPRRAARHGRRSDRAPRRSPSR